MNKSAVLFALMLSFHVYVYPQPEPITLKPGAKAVDFHLRGIDNTMYSLDSFRKSGMLVIVFSALQCPAARAYEDRLMALQDEFGSKGVQLVVINPNHPDAVSPEQRGGSVVGDSFAAMRLRASDKGYNFPFL